MITVDKKKNCTGCGACISACPVRAVSFTEDTEGFRYPHVETDKCIRCNKCNRSCPMVEVNNPVLESNFNYPNQFFAGQLKDTKILREVSSGGVFWALAQTILSQEGVVYGAIQENVENVHHIRATSIEQALVIRKSKYFQSDVGNCYELAKSDLKAGKIVLFSGTACQIAGLNVYLNKAYENLYTCDVVCHGVPAMKAWRAFREEYEAKYGKIITNLVFRDKSLGWSKNQYCITHNDGSVFRQRSTQHLFHAGYLQGLFYRPSCGSCRFSKLPRVSDITLADFWRYNGEFHSKDKDLGVSLISINNEHGMKLLIESKAYLKIEKTTRELALSSCKHLNENPSENHNRKAFFDELDSNGYYAAADKFIHTEVNYSLTHRLLNKIRHIMRCENAE